MFDKKPAEQKLDPVTLTRNKFKKYHKKQHLIRKLRLHRRKRFNRK